MCLQFSVPFLVFQVLFCILWTENLQLGGFCFLFYTFVVCLNQWFSAEGALALQGTFGNGSAILNGHDSESLTAPSGKKLGMLLNILQSTGQVHNRGLSGPKCQ